MEDCLASILSQLSTQSENLQELSERVRKVEAENEILKKEVLGAGYSMLGAAIPTGSDTLRKIIDRVKQDVEKIRRDMRNNVNQEAPSSSGLIEESQEEVLLNSIPTSSNRAGVSEVVPITIKSFEEERKWIQNRFLTLRESNNSSIMEEEDPVEILDLISAQNTEGPTVSSCVFQISNFSSCHMTSYRHYLKNGTIKKTPLGIRSGESKVVLLQGNTGAWSLLYSLKVLDGLRLTLLSSFDYYRSLNKFGIAFTPEDVTVDQDLFERLEKISNVPDIWVHNRGACLVSSRGLRELYVQRGLHLACAKIEQRNNKTWINVDILEDSNFPLLCSPNMESRLSNNALFGRDFCSQQSHNASYQFWENSPNDEIACLIQLENNLPVRLINGRYLFRNTSYTGHQFLPHQIQPFSHAVFCANSGMRMRMEAVFCYEIKSTDLTLSIYLNVDGSNNSFSAAFEKSPLELSDGYFERLEGLNTWNIHDYKKHALAQDGIQVIQARNIRAEMLMTTAAKASFKVRAFTVQLP